MLSKGVVDLFSRKAWNQYGTACLSASALPTLPVPQQIVSIGDGLFPPLQPILFPEMASSPPSSPPALKPSFVYSSLISYLLCKATTSSVQGPCKHHEQSYVCELFEYITSFVYLAILNLLLIKKEIKASEMTHQNSQVGENWHGGSLRDVAVQCTGMDLLKKHSQVGGNHGILLSAEQFILVCFSSLFVSQLDKAQN